MKANEFKYGALVEITFDGQKVLGRLMSGDDEVANIKGLSQSRYQRAAYHFPWENVRLLSQPKPRVRLRCDAPKCNKLMLLQWGRRGDGKIGSWCSGEHADKYAL